MENSINILINEKIHTRIPKFKRFCNHIMTIVRYKNSNYLVDMEFYKEDGFTKLGKKLD